MRALIVLLALAGCERHAEPTPVPVVAAVASAPASASAPPPAWHYVPEPKHREPVCSYPYASFDHRRQRYCH